MSKKKKAVKRKTTRATTTAARRAPRDVESVIDPDRSESWGGGAPIAGDVDGGATDPNDPRHWGGGKP